MFRAGVPHARPRSTYFSQAVDRFELVFPVYSSMGRQTRYVPEGGALVEVTTRTQDARLLLRPDDTLNAVIVGVLARAKRLYPLRICGLAFMSSHYHLLLDVDDAQTLSRFMAYVNGNIAREAGRLHNWHDHIWSRRYQSIVVSNEELTQTERLSYVLAHGVKEGWVESTSHWPGVHCAKALVEGTALEGVWFDRTKEYAARRRGEDFDRYKYATRETLTLDPLPCWRHLSPERRQKRAAELVAKIDADAAARRAVTGITPPGPDFVRNQRPHDRVNRP